MDDRRDAEARADQAVFASARVRASGDRPAWLGAASLVVSLGGLVVAGLLQAPQLEGGRAAANVVPPELAARAQPQSERFRGEPLTGPAAKPSGEPASNPAALVDADLRVDGQYLFVHGEVISDRVVVVAVSLREPRGQSDTRTVHVPGGSTAFRIGAVDRFDVHFKRPAPAIEGKFSVRITCYDKAGVRIDSLEVGGTTVQPVDRWDS